MPDSGIFAARVGRFAPVVKGQTLSAAAGSSRVRMAAPRGPSSMRRTPLDFLPNRGAGSLSRLLLQSPLPYTRSSKQRYRKTDFTVLMMQEKPGGSSIARSEEHTSELQSP